MLYQERDPTSVSLLLYRAGMRVVLQATNKHYGLGNEPSQNLIGKQNALMFTMDTEAWWVTVCGVPESRTRLSN